MTRSASLKPIKKSLSIRLSESAVYLRTDNPSGRSRRNADPGSSMLRGLLVLELAKPMKVSSIELELTATALNAWPEGTGARRIEVSEEHRAFHASTVFFRASKSAHSTRRTASVGPGIISSSFDLDNDWDAVDDEEIDDPLHPENDHVVPATNVDLNHSNSVTSHSRRPHAAHDSNNPTERRRHPNPLLARNRRVSVDSHFFQRHHVSYHDEYPHDIPIPPYSPLDPNLNSPAWVPSPLADQSSVNLVPIRDRSPSATHDPAHDLEEFRASLNTSLRNLQRDDSVPSIPDRSLSRVPSGGMDNVPEDEGIPPPSQRGSLHDSDSSLPEAGPSQIPRSPDLSLNSSSPSLSGASGEGIPANSTSANCNGSPRLPSGNFDYSTSSASGLASADGRSRRSRSRFSLSSMAGALRNAVRSPSSSRILSQAEALDRAHSRTRSIDGERSGSQAPRGRTMDRRDIPSLFIPNAGGVVSVSPSRRTSTSRSRKSRPRPSLELGRIFGAGFDTDLQPREKLQRKEEGNGWKEFKAGTYTYPISFSIPNTAPPTLHANWGSVVWRLNATVHRPGVLKQKLAISREVTVVTCPTDEDTEDTENIIVERHWEHQLQYLISISGKSFYIGGTVPVSFALLPLAKIKVYRLMVYIEERVDYYTRMHRVARNDPVQQFELLSVKHEGGKNAPHILPLESDDVDILRKSPLQALINPEDDESEVASMLMGPGPWTFHQDLKLPDSCETMRFTNKNRRANIVISHLLKVVMRVERGDDLHLDRNGKRKLFDIVVQTPIQILSCRCNPEWVSLPRYSETFNDDAPIYPTCPCQTKKMKEEQTCLSPHHHRGLLSRLHHHHHHHNSESTTQGDQHEPPPVHEPPAHLNDGSSDVSTLETSQQFERLVAGFESEFGEPPPAYTPSGTSFTPLVRARTNAI
ncbi:cyclin binding protein [Coprinopsis cinerea okayama7|uniref:Cyclin binding protein n=1 Tax=Coprinopsis cinerea (strain Okayama-7 / 130 / ATCC MYA-4618 / FGSC 9003) TaxID=240176 RepID=A8N5Q8_COPC7|nr:cyclin binding protein [Coprinopsis cinerea okayama7\|eukprot:XP_001830203.1 cyclin binding protein [Coprinopsis cinerea okayama7\